MLTSGAGSQLVADFTAEASGSSVSSRHEVMLLMILNGPDGPYALPPIINEMGVRIHRPDLDGAVNSDGRVDQKYVTFQATFGQFNNKRVSLVNASMVCTSISCNF